MKIAICFTGETRTYSKATFESWERLMKHIGAEYDFFGSTWDHCDLPYNYQDFKSFEVINQDSYINDDIISNDKFFDLVYTNDNPLFKEMFIKYGVDFLKYANRCAYGQLYSSYHAIKQVPPDDYSLIIKIRWDTRCVTDPINYDHFREQLHTIQQLNLPTYGFTNIHEPDKQFINDIVIVFNQYAAIQFTRLSMFTQISDVRHRINKTLPSAHWLWSEILMREGDRHSPGLQSNNTFSIYIDEIEHLVRSDSKSFYQHPVYPSSKLLGI